MPLDASGDALGDAFHVLGNVFGDPLEAFGDARRSVRHPSTSEPKYQDDAAGMPWERNTPGSPVNP